MCILGTSLSTTAFTSVGIPRKPRGPSNWYSASAERPWHIIDSKSRKTGSADEGTRLWPSPETSTRRARGDEVAQVHRVGHDAHLALARHDGVARADVHPEEAIHVKVGRRLEGHVTHIHDCGPCRHQQGEGQPVVVVAGGHPKLFNLQPAERHVANGHAPPQHIRARVQLTAQHCHGEVDVAERVLNARLDQATHPVRGLVATVGHGAVAQPGPRDEG
eukprot:scaffold2354_cov124-Isochrysis_galbana.AAC.8